MKLTEISWEERLQNDKFCVQVGRKTLIDRRAAS